MKCEQKSANNSYYENIHTSGKTSAYFSYEAIQYWKCLNGFTLGNDGNLAGFDDYLVACNADGNSTFHRSGFSGDFYCRPKNCGIHHVPNNAGEILFEKANEELYFESEDYFGYQSNKTYKCDPGTTLDPNGIAVITQIDITCELDGTFRYNGGSSSLNCYPMKCVDDRDIGGATRIEYFKNYRLVKFKKS